MKKRRLLLLLLLCGSMVVHAQTPSVNNPTMLDLNVPSPQVTSLGKYGEEKVDMHTGVPQINIPLYTISYMGFELPVSLSYDASGIKVANIASAVGQNWNLMAGGVISRVIRGKPDEYGYSHDASLIPADVVTYDFPQNNADRITYKNSSDGLIDGQPDEFLYNFNGISGKFVLDQSGQAHLIPYADLKIQVSLINTPSNPSYIKITSDNGTQYYFEGLETTITESCADNDPNNGVMQITAWHLTRVILPNQIDVIQLQYDQEVLGNKATTYSRTYGPVPGNMYDYTGLPSWQGNYSSCLQTMQYFQQRLSRILFPTGKIEFLYGTKRTDLQGSNYALTDVIIYGTEGSTYTQKLKYHLQQGYYGTSPNSRLRLDKITQIGTNNSSQDLYSFNYDNNTVPGYYSNAQDAWGYYNGATSNTNLLPNDIVVNYSYVPGGDRAVHPNYTGAGVLKKITYPTGGYSEFEFETNNYGIDCNSAVNEDVKQTLTVTAQAGCDNKDQDSAKVVTKTFVIDKPQYVQDDHFSTNSGAGSGPGPGCVATLAFVSLTGANPTLSPGGLVYLPAGTYEIKTTANCVGADPNNTCSVLASRTVTYTKTIGTLKNMYAGGLRVKKITSTPNFNGAPMVKEYDYSLPYETDRSSGALQFKPTYQYSYELRSNSTTGWTGSGTVTGGTGNGPTQGMSCGEYGAIITVVSSNPMNTGQFQSGQSVIYRYVREKAGANGSNGSTLYQFFFNGQNQCDAAASWPFIPKYSYKHRNGLLLNQSVYDVNGTLVKSINNSYSYPLVDAVPGWKAMCYVYDWQCDSFSKYAGTYYLYKSEKIQLDSTTTTDYPGGNAIATTTRYYYDNQAHIKPTRTNTTIDGNDWWQYNRYANDFTTASYAGTGFASAVKALQQNNNNALIETYKAKKTGSNLQVNSASVLGYNPTVIAGLTEPLLNAKYDLETSIPISNYQQLPTNLGSAQTPAAVTDTRMVLHETVTSFDSHGNALEDKMNDQPTSRLLSADGTTTLAEIRNCLVSHVAYSSFENNTPPGWNYAAAGVSNGSYVTGKKCYQMSYGSITANLPTDNYVVSYWSNTGNINVNGTLPNVNGNSVNGWVYHEHLISSGSISVTGTGLIDELRVYPATAQMKTYSYEPLTGVISTCDESSRIQYYEYDPFLRLVIIRNQQGQIVKKVDYGVQVTE